MSASLSAATKFTARASTTFEVTADNATARRRCWLLTQPIDSEVLKCKGSSIDLTTVSHHQGWVSSPDKGSWSWFELAIVPSNARIDKNGQVTYDYVKKVGNKALSWFSHSHPVGQNGSFETFKHRFSGDHELWTYLQLGDRLAVFGCAQFPSWSCHGSSVELKLGERPGGTDAPPQETPPQTKPVTVETGKNEETVQTGSGPIQRVSTNRITCKFEDKQGVEYIFSALFVPALPDFAIESANLGNERADVLGNNMTGTCDYYGYVGKKEIKLTFQSSGKTITEITGTLVKELRSRNQVVGSGTWNRS